MVKKKIKLTPEDKARLRELVKKLEKLDPKSDDAKAIREEIAEATNELARLTNKSYKEEVVPEPVVVKKVKHKAKRQKEVQSNELDTLQQHKEETKKFISNIDEEQLLDKDTMMDLLKAVIVLNQQCIDYTLILLENANDIQAGRIKKCIDANTENKRNLKMILKECIDTL